MPYITSVERIGFERGLEEGQQIGRQEGQQIGRQEEGRLLLQRQLVGKFGALPEHLKAAIEALSLETIESLAIALLNFASVKDLEDWLTP